MKKSDNNGWQAFCEGFGFGLVRVMLIGAAALLLMALYIHLQQ
ncbi:MAG TPA: hypothetical protein PKY96_18610 [Flavobacteriales bacterium]|nr:hypothetical protein [Flavobacteriales bacterium]